MFKNLIKLFLVLLFVGCQKEEPHGYFVDLPTTFIRYQIPAGELDAIPNYPLLKDVDTLRKMVSFGNQFIRYDSLYKNVWNHFGNWYDVDDYVSFTWSSYNGKIYLGWCVFKDSIEFSELLCEIKTSTHYSFEVSRGSNITFYIRDSSDLLLASAKTNLNMRPTISMPPYLIEAYSDTLYMKFQYGSQ